MPDRLHSDPNRPVVEFTFNGRTLLGYEGEPIAAALLANGVHSLHRSLKFRNARGVRCAVGRCGQCCLNVDGRVNVRSCTEPLRPGMEVRTQRGWPSAEWDLGRWLGAVAGLLPHGFQYRMFIRPRFLKGFFHKFLTAQGGYGKVEPTLEPFQPSAAREIREVDVLIIGGGVAGLACGRKAAESGSTVVVLDDRQEPGGTARFDPRDGGPELVRRFSDSRGVELLLGRQVIAIDNGVIAASVAGGIEKYRAQITVIATGGYDNLPPFAGNDSLGVFGERAILRMVNGWGVAPADSVAVFGSPGLVKSLVASGIYAVEIGEPRPPGPGEAVVCGGSIPTYELQSVLGLAMTVDKNGAMVARVDEAGVTSRPDVFVTGKATGNCDHQTAMARGEATGAAVAEALAGELLPWLPAPATIEVAAPTVGGIAGVMLCACEDVTEEEFVHALTHDYPDIESAKRFTSLSMGVCQGKYCLHRARCLTAATCGTPLEKTPLTTQRPPLLPVTLGAFAAEAEE
jgi:sarcosine oxidase subunit alpha